MSHTAQENIERLSQDRLIRQQLTVEYPKKGPTVFILLLLALLLLIWGFVGRIPTEIAGKGVSIGTQGTFLITSNANGRVTALFVKEGDRVEKGAPLGTIYNPEVKATLVQIEATEFKIMQLETELELLMTAYQTNEQLFTEGLISRLVLDDSKTKVYEKRIEIEQAKSDMDAHFSKLANLVIASEARIAEVRKKLLDGEFTGNLDAIANQLSIVQAPDKSVVLEVLVDEGDKIDRKTSLFWMEHHLEKREETAFYSTVSADVIGQIRPGMRVLIEPLIVNPQEYGAIIGEVEEVYAYPVSEEELMQEIGNKRIVGFLMESAPVTTFMVLTPHLNPNTPSGYEWTSEQGPPFPIPTGTVCNLKLVIDEQPPISYLVPLWRIRKAFSTEEPDS